MVETGRSRHAITLETAPRAVGVPRLDLSSLEYLLSTSSTGNSKGKKRAASPVSSEPGPRKRARPESGGVTAHAVVPRAKTWVYRHVFNLEFTSTVPPPSEENRQQSDNGDEDAVEDQERNYQEDSEKRAISWLAAHSPKDEPNTIDLGEVCLEAKKPSREARSFVLQVYSVYPDNKYVFELPIVLNDAEASDYDIRSTHVSNLLFAFEALARDGRAEIFARLYMDTHDPTVPPVEHAILPFSLRVEVEVALIYSDMTRLCSPSHKGRQSDIEDAQRRVLMHYLPYSSSPPESFQGSVDIPLLYSILGSAPRFGSLQEEEYMQPEGLVPTLLPFQRRSVAWMLAREGKRVDGSGDVIPALSALQELPLLWDEVRIGNENWYINRVRGMLSRERPQEETAALGGILAEEPGLGKTLECIALIILNPSIGRGPLNKRWDPEAKVHVKEVKTTLIVTPNSLAQQWADELALHAPSLKVLVYDGWAKVPVPITEAAIKKLREERSKKIKAAGRVGTSSTRASSTARGRRKRSQTVDTIANMDADETPPAEQDPDDDDVQDWCSYVNAFDVCITTYNVLQHELRVARAPPTRPRRANVLYAENERTRSPLIMCEWYRVIMDEVQMVGGGQAEEMVSLIPRLSSFAVSGTPARAQVSDLVHVFRFLRVEPVTSHARTWSRLIKPPYINDFVSLFRKYSIRTIKAAVKDELTIPKQTRYLVPIELGRVERHVYDQTFETALLELGLDARGVAVRADCKVDTAVLRHWLRRLRGICTHPQVGQLLDRSHKTGVLKSMEEVLEGMRDQNWRNLMEDRRNKVQLMATIARIQQHKEDDVHRYRVALDILISAEEEAQKLIEDVKAALAEHAKKGAVLKAEAAKFREQRRPDPSADASNGKGKGKGRAPSESDLSDLDDSDSGDEGMPHNRAGEEHIAHRTGLQNRLRDARISLHRVLFLQGDVYHVLGEGHADQENKAYAGAEGLRRLLLKGTEDTAAKAMAHLDHDISNKTLQEAELYIKVPYCEQGGIRSADLIGEVHEIIDGLLNAQSALIWKWRARLIELLTQPLSSQEDNVDGQEYARSLETQGEAETYLQAYAALLADRREALTAERTLLAAHDVREAHIRSTKAAQRAQVANLQVDDDAIELDKLEDAEQRPEHEVLLQTLNEERKVLQEDFDPGRAVRSVIVDLNSVAARISKDTDPEKILVRDAVIRLKTLLADQNKLMDKLHADLTHLRRAFNERISYFRQLQEISDTIAQADWEGGVDDALLEKTKDRTALETKINAGRARQRYLDHLAQSQQDGEINEERCCVLCRCEFTRGYITPCAHVFCETCLKEWLSRREGKACPVCRVPINTDQLQRFSIRKSKIDSVPVTPPLIRNNEVVPKSRRQIEYNYMDPGVFEDIQTMESLGSYGSKVDNLLRHLLYLKVTDPEAKSIVFSAWADSLHIIQHALTRNGISCLRIDQQRGKENTAKKFRINPNISVLLLHGERENAGLNVTCASRVFLVESVVHHAFELQAIARVDRMGQTKPTEVYCYFAEDTVERNILDLAARQGQSLYTKDNAARTLDVSAFVLASGKNTVDAPAKKVQKGDFVFKTDDMLAIFFPHLYEDIEYLVPAEDTINQAIVVEPSSQGHWSFTQTSASAQAGPSRLPS